MAIVTVITRLSQKQPETDLIVRIFHRVFVDGEFPFDHCEAIGNWKDPRILSDNIRKYHNLFLETVEHLIGRIMKLVNLGINFNPHDLWIGLYWKLARGGWDSDTQIYNFLSIYFCLIPMFPIRFDIQSKSKLKIRHPYFS
jgi:hypothetical protein